MPDSFLQLADDDRREALEVAASRTGRPANLLEKDVWVVQLLALLFSSPFGPHLVFKGGTALSKVYRVIDRFSEDVDVTYDIREIVGEIPENAVHEFDIIPETRSQKEKLTKLVRAAIPNWIKNEIQPLVLNALSTVAPVTTEITGTLHDTLIVQYPSVTTASQYAPPTVKLEFGGRSTGEPASSHQVICDMAEFFPELSFPKAEPRTMEISRIFWEKATAMHVYCLQGKDLAHRFSRHLHDIARLKETGHVQEAIAARNVAATVADHKARFFSEKAADGAFVDYSAAVNGNLLLIPEGAALEALKADYQAMIVEGLLREDAQTFDQLAAGCIAIQKEANDASTSATLAEVRRALLKKPGPPMP